jgi:uncharacterized protein YkwD
MNTPLSPQFILRCTISTACLALLAACGGGGDSTDPAGVIDTVSGTETSSPAPSQPPTTPGTPSPGGAGPGAGTCDIPNFQTEMLRAINEARAVARSCGGVAKPAVAALAWNNLLFNAAAAHSTDMAQRNYFEHNTPEGVTPFQRMEQAGYKYSSAGENIAAGQNDIASVMTSWLKSPDHCKIIMGTSYKDVGTACIKDTKGTPYWTLNIASPR